MWFFRSRYQEVLEIEFKLRGIPFESQKLLDLKYKGTKLKKKYMPDFLVFEKIILEIKAESK